MKFTTSSTLAFALATLSIVHADLLAPGDLDFIYTMDAPSSSQDLDSNSTADWFAGTSGIAGDALNNSIYSGGTAQFRDSGTASSSSVLRTDTTGSIWRNNFLGDDSWMVQATLKVLDEGAFPEGASGTLLISGGIGGVTPIARIYKDRIDFSSSSSGYTTYLTGSDFTDGFHTFLIGRDNEGEGWLWVDDVLIAQDQIPISGLTGGHANGLFLGGQSFSGGVRGAWEIDTLGLKRDFVIPDNVPEPSTGLLLGLGLLALARRRRV